MTPVDSLNEIIAGAVFSQGFLFNLISLDKVDVTDAVEGGPLK